MPSFLAPVSYAADPSGGGFVVTGDFNNDTVLDLAEPNDNSSGTVSVLLGNADGTFQPPLTSDAGPYPGSLAVGDFDADGKLDLVVGNGDLSVLLGNGDGSFRTPRSIGRGMGVSEVAVGDFNGDGKLDLGAGSFVYIDAYSTSAIVLLGNGDGSFSGPSTTALYGGSRGSPAVADFNGDGKLDFATANSDVGEVNVLLGDGLGNLQPAFEFPTGSNFPQSVAAGDVNGDGNIDLVTVNSIENYSHTVNVLLGNGAGSFGSAQVYAAGNNPNSGVLGDFNRDGQVDLMVDTATTDVSVLFGIGGGAFSQPRNFSAGFAPGAVVAGDFNSDGWLDAATINLYLRDSNRVSRSLLDFAQLVRTFEQKKVSFVSVTQQFNTATSMGRLVLNVLLSFAQFEREIISERTRDKIAATRRKGKWAGGHPILGYDVDPAGYKLAVNGPEAERGRAIFALYLEHESLLPVVEELARRKWVNAQKVGEVNR